MRLGKYLSSLTKPELERIIAKANFADEEQKIFLLLSKGKSITEIAVSLSVCERTVNRRVELLKSKISRIEGGNGNSNG